MNRHDEIVDPEDAVKEEEKESELMRALDRFLGFDRGEESVPATRAEGSL